MKATTIKKIIVCVLMTIGFVIIIADSNADFTSILLVKIVGIALFLLGIQLCATWKVFNDYLNND